MEYEDRVAIKASLNSLHQVQERTAISKVVVISIRRTELLPPLINRKPYQLKAPWQLQQLEPPSRTSLRWLSSKSEEKVVTLNPISDFEP
jgi:hypothetical protein